MFHKSAIIFLVLSRCVFAWAARSIEATFIAPAAPTVTGSASFHLPTSVSKSESLSFARSQVVSSGYGLYSPSALQAKKKKTSAPAGGKKIQVKLLKHVAGSGQAGDVIQVTPPFFNNKLKPTQLAIIISDEEVAKEKAEADDKASAEKSKANELQEVLNETTLIIKRKAGPDGQLFGGIGSKVIMEKLKEIINDDFLSEKWIKVAEISGEDGKKMRGDIKHTGEFGARITLLSDISARIVVSVHAE
jgi:large subunit ribosomal protein L9